MDAIAIEARDLVKTYPRGVTALDHIGFSVPAGSLFALLGPDGAGKSTAVKILTTLARADSGQCRVAGHDVRSHPDRVREVIGVVGQDGRRHALRGRMLRRLDIARGLARPPEVLFLDEPTRGIDPEVRTQMWREITRLRDEEDTTILLTTHSLEEADRLAQRVALLDHGRIVAEGAVAELKGSLRGDAIQIELSAEPRAGEVRAALAGLGTLREVILNARSLRVRADDGAATVPGVVAALKRRGLDVASVTVAEPSLDDVYLRYTGRTLSQTT